MFLAIAVAQMAAYTIAGLLLVQTRRAKMADVREPRPSLHNTPGRETRLLMLQGNPHGV